MSAIPAPPCSSWCDWLTMDMSSPPDTMIVIISEDLPHPYIPT